ncbi:MAG: diphosphate--fructose-6-phosphate 1-phosphotransferase [Bryobacteraceae bacterium]|nr:diphosphate--fructose-6-phosphate 1-phosphotransferase [Bryobacteraceae bacterium]
MSKRAILIHGGGPTAVLNASLAGLALELRRLGGWELLGARFGMAGLLQEHLIDLDAQPEALLEALAETPGSAIGSSRKPLEDEDFAHAAGILHRRAIDAVFLNGGNGTMRTAARLEQVSAGRLRVIGIPKTIDNDIPGTDHTPGYGSVARFFAHAVRDAGEDNRSLPSPVMVVETLGRDTGWVTAATALARTEEDDAPHLIYLPEQRVPLAEICADVERTVARWGRCVIAVCEGQLDENGLPFGADVQKDRDGMQRLAANLGHRLAQLIEQATGLRARSEKPGLTGRSSGVMVSPRDRADARACGEEAARAAGRGEAGVMVRLDHSGRASTISLGQVTPGLRQFPQEWIAGSGAGVSSEFVEWVKPLAGEVSAWPRLTNL